MLSFIWCFMLHETLPYFLKIKYVCLHETCCFGKIFTPKFWLYMVWKKNFSCDLIFLQIILFKKRAPHKDSKTSINVVSFKNPLFDALFSTSVTCKKVNYTWIIFPYSCQNNNINKVLFFTKVVWDLDMRRMPAVLKKSRHSTLKKFTS